MHPNHNNSWRDRAGHYLRRKFRVELRLIHVHLVLVLLLCLALIGVAFVAGWVGGSTWADNYYRQHYTAPIPVNTQVVPVARSLRAGSLPYQSGINFAYMPPVHDQGPLGSCEAHATTEMLSEQYDEKHNRHIQFSAHWSYDQATGGADVGSSFPGNLQYIPSLGIPRWREYPYPAYTVESPAIASDTPAAYTLNSTVGQQAALWKPSFTWNYLYANIPGLGGVDLVRQQLAAGKPVNLAIEVTQAFDQATQTAGHVDEASPGAAYRGGHALMAVYYNDDWTYNGVRGWVLAENSWGTSFGTGEHGSGYGGGYVLLSYRFLAQYSFYANSLEVTS